jgi:tRNA nucleotidyltransferase (CCA-adding enzyme)
MSRFAQIFDEVLQEIIPTQQEIQAIDNIVEELKQHLKVRAIELGIKYTSMEPQGSTGIKQTQLRREI